MSNLPQTNPVFDGFEIELRRRELGLRPPRKIPLVAELVTGGFAGEPPLNTGPIPVGFDVPGADAGLQ